MRAAGIMPPARGFKNCLLPVQLADLDGDEHARLDEALELRVEQADALLAGSNSLDGFLETPALLLAAQSMAADTVILEKDARLGPYRIVGLLAHGGMGDVYRATDLLSGQQIALKLLPALSSEALQRFSREVSSWPSCDTLASSPMSPMA